jgi:hypothetical protein
MQHSPLNLLDCCAPQQDARACWPFCYAFHQLLLLLLLLLSQHFAQGSAPSIACPAKLPLGGL